MRVGEREIETTRFSFVRRPNEREGRIELWRSPALPFGPARLRTGELEMEALDFGRAGEPGATPTETSP
jgi:hypothetical protein